MTLNLPGNPVVLFDGICNLCSSAVYFIIKRDRKRVFRFVPLQSKTGIRIMEEYGIDSARNDYIVLLENGRVYSASTAALRIAGKLDGLWPVLRIFIIIPVPIRNFFYKFVARNRYRWFGKKNSCIVPEDSIRELFIDY